ncbi:hypothetical protein FIBSPDRAFT_1046362 [Athelia psychrophila]|uniref:Tim44-like domain-containing protein n=1 Tax=Athelia psychrophila TaxID=1759441 RepID=A0A166GSV4_9AGAM|nr:hypothetical protein FIBSPDRAFT_1046362 [Fibularhizoctonia sp. CBS 109695]
MPVASRTSHTCLDILSGRSNMALAGRGLGMTRRSLTRGYATSQKKTKTLARAAQPNTPVAPTKGPSPAPVNTAKKASAKTSSQGMVEAMRKEQAAQQKKDALEKQKENTEEQDAAAHTDYMNRVSKQAPSLDLWSQAEMDVLDLAVPVRNQAPWGLRGARWYWDNLREATKSAMAIMQLTNGGAFPPLYSEPHHPYGEGKSAPPTQAPAEFKLWKPSHISQALKFHSAAPGAWGAGIPTLSLSLYKQMCQAIAENDKETIVQVTASQQREILLKSLSGRSSDIVYKWKFVKENSPTRIVSLRGGPAYTAKLDAPLNRCITQALVRFDTVQSFEAFNKRTRQTISEPTSRRVVEYFVVEKKGWTWMPWVIRQRIYDTSTLSEPTEKKIEARGLLGRLKFWQ